MPYRDTYESFDASSRHAAWIEEGERQAADDYCTERAVEPRVETYNRPAARWVEEACAASRKERAERQARKASYWAGASEFGGAK